MLSLERKDKFLLIRYFKVHTFFASKSKKSIHYQTLKIELKSRYLRSSASDLNDLFFLFVHPMNFSCVFLTNHLIIFTVFEVKYTLDINYRIINWRDKYNKKYNIESKSQNLII